MALLVTIGNISILGNFQLGIWGMSRCIYSILLSLVELLSIDECWTLST